MIVIGYYSSNCAMALQHDSLRMERLQMALHKALDTAISTSLHVDIYSIVKKEFGESEFELLQTLFPTKDQYTTLSEPPCTYSDSKEETYLQSLHHLRKKIEVIYASQIKNGPQGLYLRIARL